MSPVGAIFVLFPPRTGTNLLHPRSSPKSLSGSLAVGEGPQWRGMEVCWTKQEKEEEGRRRREEREGERGWESGGVEQRKQWKDPLATQPDRENELSQTNRGGGGVFVEVVPCVQSKPSRVLHAHHGKKILEDIQKLKSTAIKRAMVRFRGARKKGAMTLFVECREVLQENTMEGPLWRRLGSHDAA